MHLRNHLKARSLQSVEIKQVKGAFSNWITLEKVKNSFGINYRGIIRYRKLLFSIAFFFRGYLCKNFGGIPPEIK
jgi:hypothetical protein